MKRINKILLVVVLLATTLLLSSCRGDKNLKIEKAQFVTVNETSGELTADFGETKSVKEVKNLEAFFVLHNGNLKQVTTSDSLNAEEVHYQFPNEENLISLDELTADHDVNDAYKKVYTFKVVDEYKKSKKETISVELEFTYTQYNSNLSAASKTALEGSIIGVAANTIQISEKKIVSSGAVLRDSYVFESKNIEFYEISVDGTASKIKDKDEEGKETGLVKFSGYFTEEELIEDKKYINYVGREINYLLTLSDDKIIEKTIDIWLAQGAAPLNPKTASFWNWLFLQMPIAYFMSFIGKITGASFAIAILITTIAVRTLAWPIYAKTNDMSMKMSLAQPDIDKLNRKYATRKDPESQQKMQMEMMQLYKKHKISMWGCLLPFLQMPIFFAMYEVVRRITIPGGPFSDNVFNTKFFWTDLSAGGIVSKIVFTALVGLTMFALQKVSALKPSYAKTTQPAPKAAGQPNTENTMKIVSYVMIFMMVMTAYVTPGLALSYYWIIGNIYSIAQTFFNRKISEKKHAALKEEQLYGNSREIIDAKARSKGDK